MIEVFSLRVQNGAFINYTYVVVNKGAGEALIVDPGFEYTGIANYIVKTGYTLKAVLLTHHHTDHVQMANDFAQSFNVPVYMSSAECNYYNFRCLNLQPVPPDHFFAVGDFDVFMYHTPGHTKGSACFQVEQHLFTGDTLFVEGCGMCAGKGADPVDMYYSLQKLKQRIEPLVRIYPGHSFGARPGVVFDHVLKENLYLHFTDVNRFVAFRIRKNQNGIAEFR